MSIARKKGNGLAEYIWRCPKCGEIIASLTLVAGFSETTRCHSRTCKGKTWVQLIVLEPEKSVDIS